MGWTVRGSNADGGHFIRNGANLPWDPWQSPVKWVTGLFTEVKRENRDVDHAPPQLAHMLKKE